MFHIVLISTIIFSCFSITKAQTDTDTSPTRASWFWPLFSACAVLLVGIPCVSIVFIVFFRKKYKWSDDSDESSDESSLSSSSVTTSVRHERRRGYHRQHRSHFAQGFRTPPPPYTSNDHLPNLFAASSPPPPYERPVTFDRITNTASLTNSQAELATENAASKMRLDASFTSSMAPNTSVQTFQS